MVYSLWYYANVCKSPTCRPGLWTKTVKGVEGLAVVDDQVFYEGNPLGHADLGQPYKPRMRSSVEVDEFTESLVHGDEDPVLWRPGRCVLGFETTVSARVLRSGSRGSSFLSH